MDIRSDPLSPIAHINLIIIHPNPYIRAGSSFFQSLFDGHPEVIALPYLKPIHKMIPEYVGNTGEFLRNFIAGNVALFDLSKGYYAPSHLTNVKGFGRGLDENIKVSEQRFSECFKSLARALGDETGPLPRKLVFVMIHLAYHGIDRVEKIAKIRYLLYNPHEEISWEEISQDFPRLKYVAMMRDPWGNWLSNLQLIQNRSGLRGRTLSFVWLLRMTRLYAPAIIELSKVAGDIDPGRLKIIDLDRLHQMNRSAIDALCSWLGIEFDEILLRSSFMGKPWGGNAANGVPVSGFKSNVSRYSWQSALPAGDQQFITSYLENCIRFLRYTDAPPVIARNQDALPSEEETSGRLTTYQYWLYFFQISREVLFACLVFRTGESAVLKPVKFIKRISANFPVLASAFLRCLKKDRQALGIGSNPDPSLRGRDPPDVQCFL